MLLKAKTARQARTEIIMRGLNRDRDVNYRGLDENGEAVLLSCVRKVGSTANVATASRNRSLPAVRFETEEPNHEAKQ